MIILWDIDGTLVDVKGAGRRAFSRAIERAWGIKDDLADVSFAGGTDRGVLDQLRLRLALDEAREPAFYDAMTEMLLLELGEKPAHAYPNAIDIVRQMHALNFKQGLLTGNEERCARIKLRSAGIDDAPLTFGAYGHEHPDRNELARLARKRAGEGDVVVIGDTPRDIAAARAIGATVIAVCTGHATRDSLSSADHVVDDLTHVLRLL